MNTPIEYLSKLDACSSVVEWVKSTQCLSLEAAWLKCERGDWMLWYAGKLSGPVGSASRRKLVGCAAACARLVLPIYQKRYPNDDRVEKCILACEGYAQGTVSDSELRPARKAAYAAYPAADRISIRKKFADLVREHYPVLPVKEAT